MSYRPLHSMLVPMGELRATDDAAPTPPTLQGADAMVWRARVVERAEQAGHAGAVLGGAVRRAGRQAMDGPGCVLLLAPILSPCADADVAIGSPTADALPPLPTDGLELEQPRPGLPGAVLQGAQALRSVGGRPPPPIPPAHAHTHMHLLSMLSPPFIAADSPSPPAPTSAACAPLLSLYSLSGLAHPHYQFATSS